MTDTDKRKELRQARDIYTRRHTFDEEQMERAVRLLAGHDLWSMAQIVAITGGKRSVVYGIVQKADHTGGRFNPASLGLLLEEIELKDRKESNALLTAKIADDGTSSYMIGRLLGQPVATVKWRIARGRSFRATEAVAA